LVGIGKPETERKAGGAGWGIDREATKPSSLSLIEKSRDAFVKGSRGNTEQY
jgi:hypothetical protein